MTRLEKIQEDLAKLRYKISTLKHPEPKVGDTITYDGQKWLTSTTTPGNFRTISIAPSYLYSTSSSSSSLI